MSPIEGIAGELIDPCRTDGFVALRLKPLLSAMEVEAAKCRSVWGHRRLRNGLVLQEMPAWSALVGPSGRR